MSAAINERQQIHDRVEKYLDTAKDLPTLPRIKGMLKDYIQNQIPRYPTQKQREIRKWCADGQRNLIYYTSSPAMKVVWWIRYHPIAITTTALGVIASLGMLYNTYGR